MRNAILIFAVVLGAVVLLAPPRPQREPEENQRVVPPTSPAPLDQLPKAAAKPPTLAPQREPSSNNSPSLRLSGRRVQRSPDGFITRMSDGSIPLIEAPQIIALQDFLNTHSEEWFGVPASSLSLHSQSRGLNETQFVYEQTHCGLSVLGSRLNMFVGGKNNLVYLRSDLHRGPFPPCEPRIALLEASALAASAIRGEFAKRALPIEEAVLAPESLSSYGKIVYLLNESGVFLVYRFEIPFEAPIGVDLEVVVGASSDNSVSLKELQKN